MRTATRLFGTLMFTILTAMVYGSGLYLVAWLSFTNLGAIGGTIMTAGSAIAPPMLFGDLLALFRDEAAKTRDETESDRPDAG